MHLRQFHKNTHSWELLRLDSAVLKKLDQLFKLNDKILSLTPLLTSSTSEEAELNKNKNIK